jgi:predicted ArsR family transcriptional regulator
MLLHCPLPGHFSKQMLFILQWFRGACYASDMADATEDRLLLALKTGGPMTAAALGRCLGMTAVGARQHLARLRQRDLVRFEERRGEVGRPKRIWHLSGRGHARFPDSHAQLTAELLDSIRAHYGEDGLASLLARREAQSLEAYRRSVPATGPVQTRLKALADVRSAEGYMAEVRPAPDSGFLLIENHCPICAAARACEGFCRSELAQFRKVLGSDVAVERTEHLIAGERRCTYRVTGGPGASP